MPTTGQRGSTFPQFADAVIFSPAALDEYPLPPLPSSEPSGAIAVTAVTQSSRLFPGGGFATPGPACTE